MYTKYQPDAADAFLWEEIEDGVRVYGYIGVKNRVAIPETIEGKPVVEIGNIRDGRFEADCDIFIPASVKRFAPNVFTGDYYYGSARKSWFEDFCLAEDHPWIKLEDNILYDEGGKRLVRCFNSGVTEIVIPEGVTVIGTGAFRKCQKLKSVTLPANLEVIEDSAFLNCFALQQLDIPDTVKEIGYNAFGCNNTSRISLMQVNVPRALEKVCSSNRANWSGFESHPNFSVQDNMLLSADGKQLVMLLSTEPVTDILIPEGVEEILPYAFAESGSVKKLTLATTVKVIRNFAFGNHRIKTLRIPAALETIEDTGFDYSGLTSVMVDKKNQNFYTDKVCLYYKPDGNKMELLCCFRSKIEGYDIPEGTVSVREGAFLSCEELKEMTLPESLEVFDERAFPASVKTFTLPNSLKTLYRDKKRNITEHLTNLTGESVFMKDHVLYQRTEKGLIAFYCKTKTEQIELLEGTVCVASHAFWAECDTLVCPSSLQRIEHGAFQNTKLRKVEFAEGLQYIGKSAFAGCNITEVSIPASVRYIHPKAFDNCPLNAYSVAEGSETYCARDGVLYTADGKTMLDVPAQMQCSEFAVPEDVEDISCAFLACEHINTIRIHAGIKNLWQMSVVGCRRLKDLYVDGDPEFISLSFIDYDYPIRIHTNPDSSMIGFVENMQSRTYGNTKLSLVINGMEDLNGLSKEFQLLPNTTGISISKCLQKKAEITVPQTIGKYTVTAIGKSAFAENWGQEVIESVELPNTITDIADNAFSTCRKLHTLKMHPGIKTIGKKAFHSCAALTEMVLPEGVEEIGDSAFFGCEALRMVSFPASVKKISPWVFADTSYENDGSYIHKDLYVDEKTLFHAPAGSYAESYLKAYRLQKWGPEKSLTVVNVLPKNGETSPEEKEALKYMEYSVEPDGTISVSFQRYPKEDAVEIVVPTTIMGMTVSKLAGLTSVPNTLTTLTLPASIRQIDGLYRLSFYSGGKSMCKLHIAEDNPSYWTDGDALYTKDRSVLLHMMNYQLNRYTVHPDTKIIESGAFGCFANLKTLTLPDGLQEIRAQAFDSCPLEDIRGVEKVPKIADGALRGTPWYNKQTILFNGSELAKYADAEKTSYQVPEGTVRIGQNAFYLAKGAVDSLEELILPDSVTELGAKAFMSRKKLKSIRFGNGLKALTDSVMADCVGIETLHIPASVETITADALPNSQFGWRNAELSALREITVDEDSPYFMAKDGILYSKDGGTLLKVPAAYPASEIVVPDTVHTIGTAAFKSVQNLQSVQLPPSVKVLEKNAFENCASLVQIDLSNIEQIGDYALYECKALETAELRVKETGSYAFCGCHALKNVRLNNTVKVEKYTFKNCLSLKDIVLPDTLETILEGAFENCGFNSVTVPKSVKTVGYESFSGCFDITVYDSIDPDAKAANEHKDLDNGYANSLVGFMGIGPAWAMWQCAANHTWADHEITVRSAETDEIKYKVAMCSDPKQRSYYCLLTSSWGKNATFNFAALDEFFPDIKGVQNKLPVALNRLRYPVELSEAQKESYIAYLVRSAKDLVKNLINSKDMETLQFCAPFGILKKNNIDELIEYAAEAKAAEFAAWLMEYKDAHFAGKKTTAKLPSLSVKIEEPWQAPKSGTSKIGRYKGTETEVVFPTEWKGKPLTGVAGTTSKVPENYLNITSVVLPEGYTTIGDYAFFGCKNLEKITLPTTLESIGKNAFTGCTKLKEFIMPDTVTEIEPEAFKNCTSLEKVRLSKNLTSIPEQAFFLCDSLETIELPAKVRSVGKESLYSSGIKKIIVHGSSLSGNGMCTWYETKVHAYASANISVYGITKRNRLTMTIAEQAADLLLTLSLTNKDGSETLCNFFLENCSSTMQQTTSTDLTRMVKEAADGKALLNVLIAVYGEQLLLPNNAAEVDRLAAADIHTVVSVTLTEEKKHADGSAETVFSYSAAKHKGTMKTKETLTMETTRSSYRSYYNAYYSAYGDHVDNEKEKSAETAKDDGFTDISDSAEVKSTGVFKTDDVGVLDFQGKIFVLTGFDGDDEQKISSAIIGKGGEIRSSVVLKTNYLIVNEAYDHETTKYKKALELKEKGKEILIISSGRFYELTT